MIRIVPTALVLSCVCAISAAEDPGYPCWRGVDGSGAAPDHDVQLIDDFAQARRVWESEERKLPSSYHLIEGGAAGPVLADGRLYLNYCVPSPTCIDDKYWKDKYLDLDDRRQGKLRDKHFGSGADPFCQIWFAGIDDMRTRCAITAHDMLLCVDARTGRTVWKRGFEDKGVNRSHGRHMGVPAKEGPHAVPCVADGLVFAVGSTGRVYACDAATGELRWEYAELKAHHKCRWDKLERMQANGHSPDADQQAFLADMHQRYPKGIRGQTPQPNNGPAYADGVVLVNFWGLHAFDARTGRLGWSAPGANENCGPLIWRHGEDAYVIIGQRCYDVQSGELCWETPDTHGRGTPAIANDHLVHTGDGKEHGLTAYRIAPQGFELAWQLGPELASESHCTPVIYHERVYTKIASSTRGRSHIVCLDLATGKELGRTSNFRNDGCGSMLAADGRLYYDGGVLLDADPAKLRVLGEPPAGFAGDTGVCDAASATPVLYGGLLFMRGQYALYCFDLRR